MITSCSAFLHGAMLAQGTPESVAATLRATPPPDRASDLLVFDDASGSQIDLDLRPGQPALPVAAAGHAPVSPPQAEARGPGRPRLGVTAREVTLLPRHWDWLAARPEGASAAIRRLVEAAMRAAPGGRDAACRFLGAIAGDLPGCEAAVRAIYAGDSAGLEDAMAGWPGDICHYTRQLVARDAAMK